MWRLVGFYKRCVFLATACKMTKIMPNSQGGNPQGQRGGRRAPWSERSNSPNGLNDKSQLLIEPLRFEHQGRRTTLILVVNLQHPKRWVQWQERERFIWSQFYTAFQNHLVIRTLNHITIIWAGNQAAYFPRVEQWTCKTVWFGQGPLKSPKELYTSIFKVASHPA